MSTTDQRTEEFLRLKKQEEENVKLRAKLEEKLEAAKKALRTVVEAIQAAGYDPKTLEATVQKEDAEASRMLAEYKEAVEAESAALKKIEAAVA